MGIPLLYPWANRLGHRGYEAAGRDVTLPDPDGRYPLDPDGLPIHGALPGDLVWEASPSSRVPTASTRAWPGTRRALLELFPFEHELELEAIVSDGTLSIATTVLANGAEPRSGVVRVSSVPAAAGRRPGDMARGAGGDAASRARRAD